MKSFLKASASLAVMLTAMPAVAIAQDDDDDDGVVIEEILVTARKRETTLLETPIALTAIGGEQLDLAQTRDIRDIQTLVPTLQVSQFAAASNTSFSIRGIGSSTFNFGIEPAVGVFVDGVYRSRNGASISDFLGMERVEVLRGPQSTLFGKNTTAGVINFITKKPDYEWGYEAEATTGNFGAFIGKLGVEGGIIEDTLAFRVDAYMNRRDGFIENVEDGRPVNERDRYGFRGQLLYEPTDQLSVRVIADYNKIDEACCGAPFSVISESAQPVFDALGITRFDPVDPFSGDTAIDGPVANDIETSGFSAEVNYDFDGFVFTSITAWRSYDEEQFIDADFADAEINRIRRLRQSYDTFSQEIRLTSNSDGAFEWMVGAYYFDQDLRAGNRTIQGTALRPFADLLFNVPELAALDPLFAASGFTTGGSLISLVEGLNGEESGTYLAPGSGLQRSIFRQENKTYGVFANFDYHVTDRLTLTAGARFTRDDRDLTSEIDIDDPFAQLNVIDEFNSDIDTILQTAATGAIIQGGIAAGLTQEQAANPAINPGFANFGAVLSATDAALRDPLLAGYAALTAVQFFPDAPNVSGDRSDEEVTYNFIASYDVTDDINFYASYTTGFKGGGFALDASAARVGDFTFDPETTESWEAGVKARLLDGRLQANVAVFDQEIEDFQANVFTGTAFVPDNAGSINMRGLEFDTSWLATDELMITAAGAWLWDREYGEFPNGPCPAIIPPGVVCTPTQVAGSPVPVNIQDLGGREVSGTAEFRGTLTATYRKSFGDGYEWFVRGEASHTTDVFLTTELDPRQVQEAFTLFAASFGFGAEDRTWQVQFWSRNLTDEEYVQGSFNSTIPGGNINVYPGDPATYGVTLRLSF